MHPVTYAMMESRTSTEATHLAGREGDGMDFVAVMDQAIALLRQRGLQDGVLRAGNVRSAHGDCTSGGASRVTPDADAARADAQEGTWDRRRGRGGDRRMRIGPEHVLEAARVLRAALAPHLHRDWSVRAGDLTWSCRETLLHAADFWYAVELASQRGNWLPPMLDFWRAGLTPAEGLAAHDAGGGAPGGRDAGDAAVRPAATMASPLTRQGSPRCTATRCLSTATTSPWARRGVRAAAGPGAARARPAVSVDPRGRPVDDAVRGATAAWPCRTTRG